MTRLALVFPGQGSQTVGMLADFANYSVVHEIFTTVSDQLGYNLWDLIQKGPEVTLNQTEHTQVAMLTAAVAMFECLKQRGIKQVHYMAGHSLGEYAALVCAQALRLLDAVHLVKKRAQIMQKAVPLGQGAMAAVVGLTDEQVEQICVQVSEDSCQVSPANYNAIGQVVIAGHQIAVEKAMERANQLGARLAKIIPVSVPCHCPLLTGAAEEFGEVLATTSFQLPHVSVISNVNLSVYSTPEQMRTLLKKQLYSPVKWVQTIQLMRSAQVCQIIECGPGKVLSGLIKRIDKSLTVANTSDHANLTQALSQFIEA